MPKFVALGKFTSHFLQMENPKDTAEGLADFIARHADSERPIDA